MGWHAAIASMTVMLSQSMQLTLSAAVGRTSHLPYPPLEIIEQALLTTAAQDFGSHQVAFDLAVLWHGNKLDNEKNGADRAIPYLACTDSSIDRPGVSGKGHATTAAAPPPLSGMQSILSSDSSARAVSNTEKHGTCFVVTATPARAAHIAGEASRSGLISTMGPFPSALKLSPGLLEYGDYGHDGGSSDRQARTNTDNVPKRRLSTRHGEGLRRGNVQGLTIELSPGLLAASHGRGGRNAMTAGSGGGDDAVILIDQWTDDLMSASLDLREINFWSDPTMLEQEESVHLTHPAGALRAREWSRAADVVHALSGGSGGHAAGAAAAAGGIAPGDVCGWDALTIHHTDDALVTVSGAYCTVLWIPVTLLLVVCR